MIPLHWLVRLKNVRDLRGVFFQVRSEDLIMFLFNLCAQTCLAHSSYFLETHLPEPFNICGSFFLKFKTWSNLDNPRTRRHWRRAR